MLAKKMTAVLVGLTVVGGGGYSAYNAATADSAPSVAGVTLKLGSVPADSTLLPGVTLKLG